RLQEIAEKALKEVTYHLRFSSEWVLRLGDGTEFSKQKMQTAINELWMFTGELYTFGPAEIWAAEQGFGPEESILKTAWHNKVSEILQEANLQEPESTWMQKGGKTGRHTEHLGYILAEMQHLQRTYPGLQW
ncbi:MAG: phenylacetate-CoA oxygenase subunit PaaC, partial [Bacteroidetes bacterium]|nr:phenylacetate-CoA oxygenase subunit PaaC [Bacteroidota bacterium]